MTCLAEAIHVLKHHRAAAMLYDTLCPYEHLHGVTAWGTLMDGSLHHHLALLAVTMEDHERARSHFTAALSANLILDAPLLMARTQLHFAQFLSSLTTDDALTRNLAHSALSVFRDSGLTTPAQLAEHILSKLPDAPTGVGLTTSPRLLRGASDYDHALIKHGQFWHLTFAGASVVLPDALGVRYLSILLTRPGQRIHVLELLHLAQPDTVDPSADTAPTDPAAIDAYRTQLASLREDLAETESSHDVGRRERIHSEIGFLERELSRSLNLFGRVRSSSSERARVRVRNRITSALKLIDRSDPAAARHLRSSIHTGMTCSYEPEGPSRWNCSQV